MNKSIIIIIERRSKGSNLIYLHNILFGSFEICYVQVKNVEMSNQKPVRFGVFDPGDFTGDITKNLSYWRKLNSLAKVRRKSNSSAKVEFVIASGNRRQKFWFTPKCTFAGES